MPASPDEGFRSRGLKCIVVILMILFVVTTRVNATVVCSDCRPLALQEGPAIGLSLASGYGAASVQFVNGTTSDILIVNGEDEYIQAMKHWQAMDASTTGVHYSTTLDESLKPIADMMKTLFQSVRESTGLEHDKVLLAVPDFVITTNPSLTQPVQALQHGAGLQGFGCRYRTQSQAALLDLYGLENCHGIPIDEYTEVSDEEWEQYNGRTIRSVLSLAVDDASLTLRSMIREDGMFYPDLGAAELFWNDHEIGDGTGYVDWVGHELREFLESQFVDFDLLVLSGTEATAPELQITLQDIFKDNDRIRRGEYLRSEQDHAFAAARGAARLARVGMCIDFDACLPNPWCPISKYCRKWSWHWEDAKGRKEEL